MLVQAVAAAAVAADAAMVTSLGGSSNPVRLLTQAAVGLANREKPKSAFTISSADDSFWFAQVGGLGNETLSPQALTARVAASGAAKGAVFYDSADPNITALLPSIVTLGAVESWLPVEASTLHTVGALPVAFNVSESWAGFTEEDATSWLFEHGYVQKTLTMAWHPGDRVYSGRLVDFIYKAQLFTLSLKNGCIPFHSEHALLKKIVASAPWHRPTTVYGYNPKPVVFGGDFFEAETNCIDTLGQVASDGSENLAFWSTYGGVTEPLAQAAKPPTPTKQPGKSYVALVYGDMDNTAFVEGFARENMKNRVQHCAGPDGCFPLTWTMSPAMLKIGSPIARWYYDQALPTEKTWFIMPPCGGLYAYGTMMPDDVQEQFVRDNDESARMMGTQGSIAWEWMTYWPKAISKYFPRYNGTRLNAFFLNNVPWPVPILDMPVAKAKVVAGGTVALFRPAFNWQDNGDNKFNGGGGIGYNSTGIAKMVNDLPPGLHYVYVIQNTQYPEVAKMVAQLDTSKVELVSYHQLADMALTQ
eukprot:TRINITY_DN4530_c0_g1_i1.p1 TRINITY_DN4530_c0_g1~~TRINITY_DN4530_c0_g1_i1.p1  ORF type:complete len:530 (+),score=178.08 TRINITY_DN4530_c0_g1_i1:60-1649(+)